MELREPVIITPRLLPGVKIGDAFLSIEYAGESPDGRTVYRYHVDFSGGAAYGNSDLRSGCQGGDLRDGLESLLVFLSAAGAARQYTERTGDAAENSDLFPAEVVEWAAQNSDEIGMLAMEVEETADCIRE